MITALDSSVLWAIIKSEPGHERWLQTLMRAASEGPLIISPVAFAELSPSTADAAGLKEFLTQLAISYAAIAPDAAHLAGRTFKRYRHAGGPRQHLVPGQPSAPLALPASPWPATAHATAARWMMAMTSAHRRRRCEISS